MRVRAAVVAVVVIAACERPAPPSQSATATPAAEAAATTIPRAESLYFAGEYDNAIGLWRRELDSAARAKDSLRQAHVLMWLGLAAWRQGNNAEARTLGEQSLELKKRIRGDTDMSRSYNALGLLARDEGRLREAAMLFDQAIASARADADTAGVSRAAANIALIHLEWGEFDKARQGFEAARDAGRALGDGRVEGNALNNLGMLTIRLGDPAGAVPMISAAVERYREIEYPTGEQNAFGQLATAYDLMGEPQRALAYLDSASRIARSSGMKTEEASNLRLMGQAYATMEDHRRALTFFARAQALSRELGLKLEEATTLRSSAASHLSLGNTAIARKNTLEALRIHRSEGAAWEELRDLLMLAELATIASDPGDATGRIAEARGLARKLDVGSARAEVSLSEARIAARTANWRDVLRIVRASRSDLARARADIAWEPLSLRARAFAQLGQIDSALAAGREAIAGAERVRGRIAASGLRTGFTAARAAIYADQVIAFLRKGQPKEAFEVADAARGRALVEHLSQARAGIAASSPGTRDAVQGELLLRQIDELVSLLEDVKRTPREERTLDDRGLDALSSRITQAEREYAELLERNAAADPVQATILGTKRVATREVQAALHPGEILLEYLVAGDQLVVFAVGQEAVRHVTIPIGDSALSARVRFARELLSRRGKDSAAVIASLRGLHDILIGPVAGTGMLNDARRLIIVPHSSLTYLPFAALTGSSGHHLAERYAMLTLPSAGALVAIRSKPARQSSGNSVVVFAPLTRELPASKAEARSVAGSVGGTTSLVDGEASEHRFREAAGENRMLHLATHSILNVQNPLFTRIKLARSGDPQPETSANDGHVAVHELIAMRTHAPLAFLSGCETALGSAWSSDFVKGEDYATLSQALLYAGVRSTVATLWRINDESAAVFAGHFYRGLRTLPPAEALAAAQQKMLMDRRYRAPYHWAAYQVSGSGDRVTLEGRRWSLFAR